MVQEEQNVSRTATNELRSKRTAMHPTTPSLTLYGRSGSSIHSFDNPIFQSSNEQRRTSKNKQRTSTNSNELQQRRDEGSKGRRNGGTQPRTANNERTNNERPQTNDELRCKPTVVVCRRSFVVRLSFVCRRRRSFVVVVVVIVVAVRSSFVCRLSSFVRSSFVRSSSFVRLWVTN